MPHYLKYLRGKSYHMFRRRHDSPNSKNVLESYHKPSDIASQSLSGIRTASLVPYSALDAGPDLRNRKNAGDWDPRKS
jgi:hypothetical protein